MEKEQIKRGMEDIGFLLSQPETHHLIQLENSLVLIEQSMDLVQHIGMVLKITNDELILLNHHQDKEEYKRNRIS